MTFNNPDRLRLAIALVALKFKPPHQTLSSYVLDLQEKFPSSKSEASSELLWRNRVLLLEHDVAALQAKLEAEQIKSLALASGGPSAPSVSPNSSSEQPIPSKKKKKKAEVLVRPDKPPNSQASRLDLQSTLDEPQGHSWLGMDIPTIPGPRSLFSALNDVLQLKSLFDVQPALLLSVFVRSIESAAELLQSILERTTPNLSDPATLGTLGLVLHRILSDVIVPLARTRAPHSMVEPESTELIVTLLDKTNSLILYPLIRAFKPKSEAFLMALFVIPTGGSSDATTPNTADRVKPPDNLLGHPQSTALPTDIRADMLSLFRTVFCLLDSQLQPLVTVPKLRLATHTLRSSLILEAARELQRLLASQPMNDSSSVPVSGVGTDGKQTHPRTRPPKGTERFATKDTLWYLCTILHALFSGPASNVSTASTNVSKCVDGTDVENIAPEAERERDALGGDERLLNEGIAEALLSLVTRCKRTASSSQKRQTQTQGIAEPGQREMGSARGALEAQGWRRAGQGHGHDGTRVGEASMNGESHGDAWSGGRDALKDLAIDVGDKELGVGVSAAGLAYKDSGREDMAASMPQCQGTPGLRDDYRNDGSFELDEVGYGMLLGTIERYWVWSRCLEL
ncbi:hypothetical protein Hypma_015002 [Hypsizygus marmoreus]|uniref:Uncharacterized protein n=1 Tax=Hypsizygus marmoreus TaxID=39966 RepID=A0A369K9P2_HYPMA|nr:hypothetical protein Hypma_015002 [Hypsizygus marmoreus]